MKESKILKIISYIIIPFLIIGIVLPIVYYSTYNKDEYKGYFSSEYFNSEEFATDYMFDLESSKRRIVDVLYNDYYYKIDSENTSITYLNDSSFSSKAKDMYYVMTYGNNIWTNVELTSKTDTYDKLIDFISNRNNEKAKYVNVINGNIDSNSDVINLYGIQSTSTYKNRVYTVYKYIDREDFRQELYGDTAEDIYFTEEYIVKDSSSESMESTNSEILEIEEPIKTNLLEPALLEKLRLQNPEVEVSEDVPGRRIVFEFESSKYSVYSSYIAEYEGEEVINNFGNLLSDLSKHETALQVILPISVVLLILISIYLIISIGHDKGKSEVQLNDLDRIPFEIIFFVDCILSIPIIIWIEGGFFFENYKLFTSLAIASYFAVYVVLAINTNTIIKRIKAKSFWNTTWTGKIFIVCVKLLKKFLKKFIVILKNIINKIKDVFNNLISAGSITRKITISCIFFAIIAVIMIGLFGPIGIIIDVWLVIFVIYDVIKILSEYVKIENHLKKMYDGENVDKLEKEKFSKYFSNLIGYINNIQNGYENAVQEGIKSEKMKTELITNVSHDIKTPLTSIINYVDLLKQEKIDNEKVNEYLNILDSKSQRLKKLTEDLVEASKASSGNISLNIEKINVKELIKQSIGEFEDKFEAKKLIIEKDFPTKNVFINADNRYIYRVIENLFSNISKYALDGTRVYIEVKSENGKVVVSIKNISREKLNISEDELMQRFVRGDKSRTTEGSGLGLSISQSLTNIQKGDFKIKIDGDLFKVILIFDEV